MADCGSGMSASYTAGPTVHQCLTKTIIVYSVSTILCQFGYCHIVAPTRYDTYV